VILSPADIHAIAAEVVRLLNGQTTRRERADEGAAPLPGSFRDRCRDALERETANAAKTRRRKGLR
jgi:hypothetical protein